MDKETARKIIGEQVSDAVAYECALRDLVAFIDGLTYRQLEEVPGLFDATRKARLVLPGDPIAATRRPPPPPNTPAAKGQVPKR